MVLEAGKFKTTADLLFGQCPLLCSWMIYLLASERVTDQYDASFIKALNMFRKIPPSWPNCFPKAVIANTFTLMIKIPHTNLAEIQTLRPKNQSPCSIT